ncbi:DNA-binding domain-containing protein [Pseudomonas sp. NPDC098747]|uniref:DNA-binding domain-containing protein n=1 Tax=Pseudomonas sp. NPDC098747 TaxID=3364487 RepID=UPI00383ACAA8
MQITEPKVGAQYSLDNQILEIVSINDGLISLGSLSHQYHRFIDVTMFASMEQKGKLFLHQRAATDLSLGAQLVSLTADQKRRFSHRRAYMDGCFKELNGTLPNAAAKLMIARIATRIGDPNPPSVSTLWKWKNRYLASNRSPFSLLKKPSVTRTKRIHATVEELIRHYINTVYLTRERPTFSHTYRLLVGHVTAENRERHNYGSAPLAVPSYATFRRRIIKLDRYHVAFERQGLKAAQRLSKSSGHLYIENDPYACTLFDSQIMDVNIIDSHGQLIGRPTLSAHLNPFSRRCPGWDISIGPPCTEKMMAATIRAITNDGKMGTIFSDHGAEIFNTWALTTFNTLGIVSDYVPVGDYDAKSFIERFFGTVNKGFCHNLPGTTKSGPEERGDYPSEQRACLTLEQLRAAFTLWLEAYHSSWHGTLCTSPDKKHETLKLQAPPPEQFTEIELKQLCLSNWHLRIDRGLVKKSNLIWYGQGLAEVSQRLKPKQQAIVYFNPCDLGSVWVAHPDTPDDWHPAIGTNPEYQNGLTLSDHNAVRKIFIEERRKFDNTTACVKLYELSQRIKEYQQNNKTKKASPKPPSKKAPSEWALPRPIADPSHFPTYQIGGNLDHESDE